MLPITEDELAFLRGICDAPNDTLRRLVYADFLEERPGGAVESRPCADCCSGLLNDCEPGDLHYNEWECQVCQGTGTVTEWVSDGRVERAEFIRLQCEISAHPCAALRDKHQTPPVCPRCAELDGLRRRERELLAAYKDKWFPGVTAVVDRAAFDAEEVGPAAFVRNGFVEEVKCPLSWWESERHGGPGDGAPAGPPRPDGEVSVFVSWAWHGTGRRPGHGDDLVERNPIVKVTATTGVTFANVTEAGLLRGWHTYVQDNTGRLTFTAYSGFPTREAAEEFVSRSLIVKARRARAKLVPT